MLKFAVILAGMPESSTMWPVLSVVARDGNLETSQELDLTYQ